MRDQYMRTGQGFLLVYDVTSRTTFEEVVKFREQIYKVQDKDESEKIPIVLVGNKCDLDEYRYFFFYKFIIIHNYFRQVNATEGQELAKSFGCPFKETSAKSRINVDESWFELVREIKKILFPTLKKNPKKKNKIINEKCTLL